MSLRSITLAVMAVSVTLIGISVVIDPQPRLIWNASPSVPIGFYRVHTGELPGRDDLAVVAPPHRIARYLDDGGYLPFGLPLIKPVAALPGQRVCRVGDTISIDGTVAGAAKASDRFGRPLPVWQGCRTISVNQLFFMNPDREDSLDGRYFGPFPVSTVIGVATPL
ncbi:S26 family signal peptidase [Brevundimonas diminuta]|uniref:S26 family signal peptidase n=1 Tax=Brevundimonas diminuta TaxID=293 RepID=UPI0030FB83AB